MLKRIVKGLGDDLSCVGVAVFFMVDWRVVFCAVVVIVVFTVVPVDAELFLGFAATEPVKAHVHRFCLLGDNGVVSDADGRGVIGLDG